MSGNSWHGVRHILCVRLDSLGDVLMTTPALRALKALRPAPRLTLLTSRAGAEVARWVPEIDSVLVYAAPWMKAKRESDAQSDLGFARELGTHGFDAAVIFTVYSQSALPAALLCHLAGVPRRLAHCRENPYQLLTDWVPEPEPAGGVRHEVRRQLDLLVAVGIGAADDRLALRVPPAAEQRAAALVEELGLVRPWVVLHAGASAPSRRYP